MTDEMREMTAVLREYVHAPAKAKSAAFEAYFPPDISEALTDNIKKYFDATIDPQGIAGYFDITVFGKGKAGLLFTTDGFYYKFNLGKPIYFQYSDLTEISLQKNDLLIFTASANMPEFTLIDFSFGMDDLKTALEKLIAIDEVYGQSQQRATGRLEKLKMPPALVAKCHGIIHVAAVSCGGFGTGMAQIPASDTAVITPIQIGMLVSLGAVFGLNITEGMAKGIISSAGASLIGRTISQFLIGWIPGFGNIVNTATAAGLTEAIGWMAVSDFYNQTYAFSSGKREGYAEASDEYDRKLRDQAQAFLSQKRNFEEERDEYERLISEYEIYIKLMTDQAEQSREPIDFEKVREAVDLLSELKKLG